jgi:predicted Zn-dependent protease
MRRFTFGLIGALLLPLLMSCTVNPVTGEKELALIGEQQELAIGSKNYGPYRQAQGGDYVADPELVAYVQKVGARLAAVADRKLPYEFRVVNDDSPNAWALPGGKIAVNRGLLQ